MAVLKAPVSAHPAESSLAGIASLCAGMFCLTCGDALAKALGAHYSTVEIIFYRMLVSLPLIVVIGIMADGPRVLRTRHPWAHLMRGCLATGSAYLFITSLVLLPLAEATAIVFTSPLFVTVLSVPLLGERVGWQRWGAVAVGFLGVLAIVRPGIGGLQLATMLPLGAALLYALLMLSARRMRSENIWTTMGYMTLVPLLVSVILIPWFWRVPALAHLPAFLALGVVATMAWTFITLGFRLGSAAVVAPFDYTGLVWATLLGWLFWSEMPGPWALLGAFTIMASGIFLAYREARPRPLLRD